MKQSLDVPCIVVALKYHARDNKYFQCKFKRAIDNAVVASCNDSRLVACLVNDSLYKC